MQCNTSYLLPKVINITVFVYIHSGWIWCLQRIAKKFEQTTKDWGSCQMFKKNNTSLEHFMGKQVNGYHDWIGKYHHCSQARMGSGSPTCNFTTFQFLIIHHTIAGHLGISPSTVQNIIRRFRKFWEIFAHERHGRKPSSPQVALHLNPTWLYKGYYIITWASQNYCW